MSAIGELFDSFCLCFECVEFCCVLLWQFNVCSNITKNITHYVTDRIPKVVI